MCFASAATTVVVSLRGLDEHREAGIALDKVGDVRIVRSGKKVSFPMPRHGAILNLGGPLADRAISRICPVHSSRCGSSGDAFAAQLRNCAVSSFFSTPGSG